VVVAAAEAAWPALAGDGPACTVVETLEDARRHLTDRGVDAIVLDLHLPSTEGLEGVALLGVAAPEVPLLVLAGDDADPLVVPALAEGAQEALRVAALDGPVLWLGVQLATQRKAAALRAQREREAGGTVLDAIDSAAVALDGTGRITGCNEAWQRAAVAGDSTLADLFGQTAEVFALIDASAQLVHVSDHTRATLDLLPREMESWTPLDGIHPADRPAASEAFEWAIAHPGERRSVRARARAHPAGSWRTFDLVLTNLLDHPAVRAVTVVGNDVTAQTRSRIVAGLESRLLAQLPVAITVTDDAGIVVYWNRRSEELYGWTSEEVLGRSVEELGYVPPEESHSIYGQMLDTGHWEGELEVRTKHGTPVAILVTLQALVDDIIGFRGAVAA
jgi:PAS domain S-box-containing protein